MCGCAHLQLIILRYLHFLNLEKGALGLTAVKCGYFMTIKTRDKNCEEQKRQKTGSDSKYVTPIYQSELLIEKSAQ